jgi:hypothetical protein
MNERKKVEVPVRWILGEPEEFESIDLREHVAECGSVSTINIGESGCYEGDVILDVIAESVNNCDPECVWDLDDVIATVYRYHDWVEVLVLSSRATGRDVVAYLTMGYDTYYGQSLADIEPEVVRAMTNWAFISELSM